MRVCDVVNAATVFGLPLLPVEADTLTLQFPVFANELPFSVMAALNVPALDRLPCPNDAVTPAGNPLTARFTPVSLSPPTGVTLTVIWLLPECVIDSDVAPSPIVSPGACCTSTVRVFVAVTPSPVAVTVTAVELTVAADAAVRVSVELPPPLVSMIPFEPHEAVTPLGNPLTLSNTAPLNVPFPANVIASVTALPCTTVTVLDAVASESVGGVSETVSGRFALAVTAEPLFGAIFAVSPSVVVPAAAAELPVSVSVHTAAPAAFTDAEFQLAVTPFGSPDATLMLDPLAPLATAAPPIGVAVTITVVEPCDFIAAAVGDAVKVKFAPCVTCNCTLLVAVSPSPAAVTVTVEFPTTVAVPAASVSVALAAPDTGLTGFADQLAVTPLGSPLRLRLKFPVNDPPVPMVKVTGALAPCATDTPLDAAVSVSVGGALTVSA